MARWRSVMSVITSFKATVRVALRPRRFRAIRGMWKSTTNDSSLDAGEFWRSSYVEAGIDLPSTAAHH
jgi:hypothetical protein